MSNNRNGRPFTIIIIAITTVLALSLLPWGKLTGNFFKDFNLLEDISREKTIHETEELIDPELLALGTEQPCGAGTHGMGVSRHHQRTDNPLSA